MTKCPFCDYKFHGPVKLCHLFTSHTGLVDGDFTCLSCGFVPNKRLSTMNRGNALRNHLSDCPAFQERVALHRISGGLCVGRPK